jgi:hypothetical protein
VWVHAHAFRVCESVKKQIGQAPIACCQRVMKRGTLKQRGTKSDGSEPTQAYMFRFDTVR